MSVFNLIILVMHTLYLSSDSSCNTVVEHKTCSNICSDFESLFDIVLLERTYLPISNETNYTYTISLNTDSVLSQNNCINDILSTIATIWVEIWPSNCCITQMHSYVPNTNNTNMIEYGWKFAMNTNKFTINVPGDIPSMSTGSYWVYNNVSDTNCIHKSSITVPNICFIGNGNDNSNIIKTQMEECPSLLQMAITKENIIYCAIIIGVILIIFMALIIVIIRKHRELKKHKQQIEAYYSDFREQKNSSMKAVHYPSIAGADNVNITINNNNIGNIGHDGPTNNIYNRYSVTMNSPITLDIKSVASNYLNKQNIIPQNDSKSNEELSVSFSEDKIIYNKENDSHSNQLAQMPNNQSKLRTNNKLRYNNVPSFEDENNQMHRQQAFL